MSASDPRSTPDGAEGARVRHELGGPMPSTRRVLSPARRSRVPVVRHPAYRVHAAATVGPADAKPHDEHPARLTCGSPPATTGPRHRTDPWRRSRTDRPEPHAVALAGAYRP